MLVLRDCCGLDANEGRGVCGAGENCKGSCCAYCGCKMDGMKMEKLIVISSLLLN
jgi:hypothetical protein